MALTRIPIFPDPPTAGSGTTTTAKTPKKGGGGGGVDPYTAALQAQKRAESKARHSAARRALQDAKTLGKQAKALRAALGSQGFVQALNTGLANIARAQSQTDKQLMEGFRSRVGSLENASADNDKAAAGQAYANLTNRGRERASAISEAMAQGAGESDVLRAQQMSLRNWNANQAEISRGFFDTRTSINSSLHDLNVDTKTARMNNALQAEADRGQLYGNYFDQMSQTQTQLGNVLGQQASDFSAALEQVKSKRTRRRLRRAQNASQSAFMAASKLAGKAYSSPGVGAEIQAFTGAPDFDGRFNNGSEGLNSDDLVTDLGKPEGATLRRFE